MYKRVLAFLVLITIALTACPATGNINSFLAGKIHFDSDSVSFTVNASQSVASQTYNYQFQNNFASAPKVALGNPQLIQPCKTSHSIL